MDIGSERIDRLSRTEQVRRSDLRTFHHIMVFLAIATVMVGGALLPFHEIVDLEAARAREIGSLFLLAGIADSLILYFWDQIFGS